MKNRIQEKRKASGLTQERLAKQIHTTTRYLQKIESGGSIPNVVTVIKIADALGIADIRELFPVGDTNEEKR